MPNDRVSTHDTSKKRRRFLTAVGVGAVSGVAGCLGPSNPPGDGDDGSTETDEQTSTSTTTTRSGSAEAPDLDFGGKTLNVMINTGSFAQSFKRWVIPAAEKKFNLNINAELAWTATQSSKVIANPENPPDAVMMGRGGIARLAKEDLLEPLGDHTDVVTHYPNIYDQFKWNDGRGVAWEIGETDPLVTLGGNHFDEVPSSWDTVFKESGNFALQPWGWSNSPWLLLTAATVAKGKGADYFQSNDIDVDAGFRYLEEHVAPNVTSIWKNAQQLKQMVASKTADSYLMWIDYITPHMLLKKDISMVRRPDPFGLPYAQSVAVPKNADNKKAALAYINEALSPSLQEQASQFMAQGITNKYAEMSSLAKKTNAPTPENFQELKYPDFEYMWANRNQWGQRWSEIFGGA